MTTTFVRALPHTASSCRKGCGLKTVQVDLGYGRPVRVHCGTYRYECPTASSARR
ncbi:hypothetical protein Lesp02_85320 [Lentzea sp. NBRC 105346]|uniref:hypothetical protein n=1 Tax=Lentzea sp. NBRC 105346 TaxID=3032205 RepID=UPI0024A2A727|nr:hypothetical protein [Lentzea sp. NBRC 105346]GLZ36345.1 hypothetical protein Lesp02_85320 [Lentzea sp. NBRC 105346]